MLKALALSALLVATAAAPSPGVMRDGFMEDQTIPVSLDWRVQAARGDGPANSVQFELGYHSAHGSSTIGMDLPLASLDGLSAAQVLAARQPVSFVLHRDAGDFRCKGVAGAGQGVGTCVFAPSQGFPAALAKRGVGRPGDFQQFALALHDIGLTYVDELKRQGYATPGVNDLVRAGMHGAGLKYLTAMDAAGYRLHDVASLVLARDHGISAKYIEALATAGYAKLSAEQLVRLHDHGVSASFVADLASIGYHDLPADALVRMRDHGVSVSFIRAANHGGELVAPEELIRRRDRGERG